MEPKRAESDRSEVQAGQLRRSDVAGSPRVPDRARIPLALQRKAGNRAVSGLVERLVQRKVAASTTPGVGPKAEIADSALSGTAATRASECHTLAKAGTAFDDHPWVKARAAANGGKVPSSVKKGFKWKWPHRNNDGHLPGVPGAGGYDEYYIMNSKNDKPAEYERLVIATDGNAFHTATHYGDQGSPAFTHYKAP